MFPPKRHGLDSFAGKSLFTVVHDSGMVVYQETLTNVMASLTPTIQRRGQLPLHIAGRNGPPIQWMRWSLVFVLTENEQ